MILGSGHLVNGMTLGLIAVGTVQGIVGIDGTDGIHGMTPIGV